MGEEVKMTDYGGGGGDSNGDDDRVMEWEEGLPSTDDLTPLCQALIPMELASAFSISPEPRRTVFEVNRASQNTLSSLRGTSHHPFSSKNNNFKSFNDEEEEEEEKNRDDNDTLVIEDDIITGNDRDGSESRKMRRVDSPEEADSTLRTENSMDGDQSTRTLKRPRLVWTPQLHKRFVDVVAHLGIKNAVPKTIMQMMNVEGLTRENVASHLQKYRLYLKRMQGLSNEGPSASDPLFASTPVPQSLHESTGGNGNGNGNGHASMPIPMPYPPPSMMPMPVLSGHGQMGMHVGNPNAGNYHGFESHHHHHPYSMMQQRDWSGNTVGSYPHVAPHEN